MQQQVPDEISQINKIQAEVIYLFSLVSLLDSDTNSFFFSSFGSTGV
jgi:hypothetical protein